MSNTLFTIDNTDIIVKRVKEQVQEFKSLNGVCDYDMITHFIRGAVSEYGGELKFHERIEYVERIYNEYFKEVQEWF